MTDLTAQDVERVIGAACAEGQRRGLNLCVAVVDAGGHLMGFRRMDDTRFAAVDMSQVKARTAVMFGTRTRDLPGGTPIGAALAAANGSAIAMLPGGLPIWSDGQLLGAVGVGGAMDPSEDDEVAEAGLQALA